MAVQVNYNYATPKATAGQKADISFDEVVTRLNESADGAIKHGMAVQIGASKGVAVKLPEGATATDIDGVVVRNPVHELNESGKCVIKKGETLNVIKHGKVWARLAESVEPVYGAPAYVIPTGKDAGCFTSEKGSNLDIGAKFGTEKDDGIAIIEL